MSTILYGIPNCDTIKKAKKWLADNDIAFTFHDYRKDGIDNDFLVRAEAELGWEAMLNKRGTTFRQLEEQEKASLDKDKALKIFEKILNDEKPEPGSYRGRKNSEPENNRTTLMDLNNA